MSALALLQPALFILTQTDLGPLAPPQYFKGFRSADFSQTLLSLKLKCLHSFSKFSQVSAASSSSQSALVRVLLFFLLCFQQDNATQQAQSRGIAYTVGLMWFYAHFSFRCCVAHPGRLQQMQRFSFVSVSLSHSLLNCVFFIKPRQTRADYSCVCGGSVCSLLTLFFIVRVTGDSNCT